MKGTYRKEGLSARVTTLRGRTVETTTRESGLCGYSGGRFFSASAEAAGELPDPLLADARALHSAVATASADLRIERLRAVCGAANHRFVPEQDELHAWSETHALVHATFLAASGARVSILRGGPTAAAIDTGELARIRTALAEARERRGKERIAALVLSPPVAAAVAASLARRAGATSRLELHQQSHPAFPLDGEGRPIVFFRSKGHARIDWPNLFRPSYRSPAVPALLHVELPSGEARSDGSDDRIHAIEAVGPPHVGDATIALEALCSDREGTFFGTLEIPLASLADAEATGESRTWYPFHAGAWGRELLIRGARVR